jgi:hypothetical protein
MFVKWSLPLRAEESAGLPEVYSAGETSMTASDRFLWQGYTYEQMQEWLLLRERLRQERVTE